MWTGSVQFKQVCSRGMGMGNRAFVISDIHGCARTFNKLLDVIGLERTDSLFLLGDYIDRGPDSKGVIDQVLQLSKAGFIILVCKGNHEDMLLEAARSGVFESLLEWLEIGGTQTLTSFGVDHPQDIPEEHLQFLESLSLYHVTDQYVFVHACLDWTLPDVFSKAGEAAMLWSRSEKVIPSRIGGRTLVTGHTTQTLDAIQRSLNTKHIRIDNGCYLWTGFI
jgi:serine/threonine protein phosphatase 1